MVLNTSTCSRVQQQSLTPVCHRTGEGEPCELLCQHQVQMFIDTCEFVCRETDMSPCAPCVQQPGA